MQRTRKSGVSDIYQLKQGPLIWGSGAERYEALGMGKRELRRLKCGLCPRGTCPLRSSTIEDSWMGN